jgi:hypothetical protein
VTIYLILEGLIETVVLEKQARTHHATLAQIDYINHRSSSYPQTIPNLGANDESLATIPYIHRTRRNARIFDPLEMQRFQSSWRSNSGLDGMKIVEIDHFVPNESTPNYSGNQTRHFSR